MTSIGFGAPWARHRLGPRQRRIAAEVLGWAVAALVSAAVVAHAAVAQSQLLYSDGDSVLMVLVTKSLALGQPQNWAMSPVLFIPELAVYATISALGLGVRATLTVNAVVNFLALYATMRVVAGKWKSGRSPVLTALASFSVFAALALLEGEPGRHGYQLASLLATTTYYSSTLLGSILIVGILRRAIADPERLWITKLILLSGIALLSTLNNPLFIGWAVVPLLLALGVLALTGRVNREQAIKLGVGISGGAIVGYAARAAFAPLIVADSGNYLYPGKWAESLNVYVNELLETPSSTSGVIWLMLVIASSAGCGIGLRIAWRKSRPAESLVFLVALASPIVTALGAIATGTQADRYLQPCFFMPVAGVAAFPILSIGRAKVRSAVTWTAATISMATLIGAVLTVPRFLPVAAQADPDLACVVSWVENSGQSGGGQFWSVRGPMAYVDDPERLVQIDATFDRYVWLVNRAVRPPSGISFVIETVRDSPYIYPGGRAPTRKTIDCGYYKIVDFGAKKIPLGPAHF